MIEGKRERAKCKASVIDFRESEKTGKREMSIELI